MHSLLALVVGLICATVMPRAQTAAPAPPAPPDRAAILNAAKHVMEQARYCALITIDADGQPHARTVDAFPAEEGFVVWIGTNAATRKLGHIKRNPKVTLYYFDPGDPGYATLLGRAEIVASPEEKAKRWKEDWASFYKDRNRGDDYVLIKVTPFRVEAVSYALKVLNDPVTWAVPATWLP